MAANRLQRAKYNIFSSLALQIVSVICGLIVPRLLLGAFGSETYGATSSITQFLSYIALLEGGIGGVARAALYKPLADGDNKRISAVVNEIKKFFFFVGLAFFLYVVVLSLSFKTISHVESLDWFSSFLLVWVISFSTFLQYFVGLPYGLLLQADQKNYISAIFSIIAVILNTVLVFTLVKTNCSIIVIKFVSSIVFAIKPILQNIYVKKRYTIIATEKNKNVLEQKWTGLGQHLAFFVHTNTDVVVLTIFGNLKMVAVYAVYNMVISNIQNLTSAFSSGMEALFGELYAKDEKEQLNNTFSYYETLISIMTIILFSTTGIMIVPFVKLYTRGINDTNYIVPAFALILLLSSVLFCLRLPYHSLVIAAGQFKQTRMASYGEALLNITLSIILVIKFDLIGVAIGTVVATTFRFLYYVSFLSKNIVGRPVWLFVKRLAINTTTFIIIMIIGYYVSSPMAINNNLEWIIISLLVVSISIAIATITNYFFYKDEVKAIFRRFGRRIGK